MTWASGLPPGTFRADDNWWVNGVLRFFQKEQVRVILAGWHVRAQAKFPE
jgi:hypothetical protein